MPRYLVLGLCLLAPIALADSDDHDLAYSLGASLGERLRQEMPGLQLEALVEASSSPIRATAKARQGTHAGSASAA